MDASLPADHLASLRMSSHGDRSSVPELVLRLESSLPDSLPAGRDTALFLFGSVFHPRRWIDSLEVEVDGVAAPVTAAGMPRFDVFSALHPGLGDGKEPLPERDPDSEVDPEIRAWRSGFWATATLPAKAAGESVEIGLRARLDDGSEARVAVGAIAVDAPAAAAPARDGLIAICMSTYNPDPDLLGAQLESIRAQSHTDWVCVISDDCSRPESFRAIEEAVAGDERFVLSRSERRRGFYRGFERALELAPPEAGLIALSDQDDRWYPDKLATLRESIGPAGLVYSDQRVVAADGRVIGETYWSERANNHTDLVSLLIANTVTGAASLMRREVVERALPFPDVPGEQYHDHWLGLVALAMGEVAYVDRPLYDYVQHGSATLGFAAANAGLPSSSLRERLSVAGLRRFLGDGRGAYFLAYERLAVLAETLLARCGDRISGPKRRGLRRFADAERDPVRGVAWLRGRLVRGEDLTLGVERLLVQGILWRHALALRARGAKRPAGWRYDASMPRIDRTAGPAVHGDAASAQIQRLVSPLELSVSEREPERINLLIPTIDLDHLFGSYIAKFNLARRLAERGRRVRIVTVDPTPPLPDDWRAQVESYSGLGGALEKVEVAFGREGAEGLAVSPSDRFIATTWWTAHVARAAVAETSRDRFLYLIQEYEPFTFEMGSYAALAMESYTFDHVALLSTELLRGFFAAHSYGVYAAGSAEGASASTSFQNAITAVDPPTATELAARPTRRLLFYARAEQHARRNMFELGLIALGRAIEGGAFGPEWEFRGVGSVSGRSRIDLPGGARMEVLARRGQAEYGAMLASHDVGLALMFTPHPSLVPIEMASAGLLTVTNSFENKTPAALATISTNLIAAEPTIDGVAAGLAEAASRVGEHEARVAGADVAWSDDWERSLDDAVMGEIDALLERC